MNDREKPLIAFIDHEQTIKPLLRNIASMQPSTTMKAIDSRYDLVALLIKPDPEATLVARTLRAISDLPRPPAFALVDLCFSKSQRPEDIAVGVRIASALRDSVQFPVGVYSKFALKHIDRVEISTLGFAAVLEKFEEMVTGLREKVPPKDWLSLFETLTGTTQPPAIATVGPGFSRTTINWESGHPRTRSRSFRLAAEALVDRCMFDLAPKPPAVVLEQIGKGFSGSFLLKLTASDRRKAFLLKIDEDPQRIQRELSGYAAFYGLIPSGKYLSIVNRDRTRPVTLTAGFWGGLLMEFFDQGATLVDAHDGLGDKLPLLYKRIWTECLDQLYGSVTAREVNCGSLVSVAARTACEALPALSRYLHRWSTFDASAEALATQVQENLRRAVVHDGPLVALPMAQRVHGDLNCRNVLYDAGRDDFVLIDFPNVNSEALLSTDHAKAEVEMVMFMLDYANGLDVDLASIGRWKGLLDVTLRGLLSSTEGGAPDGYARYRLAIAAIRRRYVERADNQGDVELGYWMALMAQTAKSATYEDITIAKRLLALVWCSLLREKIERVVMS